VRVSLSPLPLLRVAETTNLWTLECARGPASEAVIGWRDAGLNVRTLRGRKMRTVPSLFDEWAAALQFPSYFGENWAAFDECVSDMDWLPLAGGTVLLVLDAEQTLADDAEDLPTLVRVLASASQAYARPIEGGEWWDRPAVPFHVVLQSLDGRVETARSRWSEAGATLVSFHT
jgi:hypothetical protein